MEDRLELFLNSLPSIDPFELEDEVIVKYVKRAALKLFIEGKYTKKDVDLLRLILETSLNMMKLKQDAMNTKALHDIAISALSAIQERLANSKPTEVEKEISKLEHELENIEVEKLPKEEEITPQAFIEKLLKG